MIFTIAQLLSPGLLAEIRSELSTAEFTDGAATATGVARHVKSNLQLSPHNPVAKSVAAKVSAALNQHAQFQGMVMPLNSTIPMISQYHPGMHYGFHSDAAIMRTPKGQMRADLSMTLFLSHPDEYEGGELRIQDSLTGNHAFKLPAGSALIYPTFVVHQVSPVTRGQRTACIMWFQSLIRDPIKRHMLQQLSLARYHLQSGDVGASQVTLTQLNTNLQRLWADL